jgi:hypothetical protein
VCVTDDGTIDDPTQGFATTESVAIRVMRGGDVVVLLDTNPIDTTAVNPLYAEKFARAMTRVLLQAGALIVTGGETAAALMAKVEVSGISLLDELEPGLALGMTRGKIEVPIVTKPGAFGDEQTLVRCLARMRQLRRTE